MHVSDDHVTPTWARRGLIAGGLFNLGVIAVSHGFSNRLGAVDALFSPAGCVVIALWGLAYISVAGQIRRTPHIAAVFALEKLLYGVVWLRGFGQYGDRTGDQPWDVALFFRTYGAADFAFGLLFAAIWWTSRQERDDASDATT